ncbi:hypothetical protein [Microtetraspora niveoalba]|uniref:hypothetical protein n=1 Tax=Microtetraspora niveoalba TaxID=46175 RepID=UPI000A00396F|nr:hypothetical protein [Microtetraspora niveoalba]
MAAEPRRAGEATPVAARADLDYYLIYPEAWDGDPSARPDGIRVEEFLLADDHTAVGLAGAVWTAADREWWSSAEFGRAMRADPGLRARVVPVAREDADAAHRGLGAGELPGETTLRTRFRDTASLPGSPPLLLTPPEIPEGFHEKRLYRILFAGEPRPERLAPLARVWGIELTADAADPRARVLGTARSQVAGDVFTWELRRIGPGAASCVDLTACLGDPPSGALGPLLRELRTAMRRERLIPVTIERFS